jgi:hypothetical protein
VWKSFRSESEIKQSRWDLLKVTSKEFKSQFSTSKARVTNLKTCLLNIWRRLSIGILKVSVSTQHFSFFQNMRFSDSHSSATNLFCNAIFYFIKKGSALTLLVSIFGDRWDVQHNLFRQMELKTFCFTPIKSWNVQLNFVRLIRPTNWVEQNIIQTKSTSQIKLAECLFRLNQA